jgi:GDP-L-fucose synthase
MEKQAKIYIAGHNGLVGSALIRSLESDGYKNIITRSFKELDLRNQQETNIFFDQNKPEYVFLAAAKVGGILANNTYKAEFIYDNIMIAANVIHASYKFGVKKLLNLGSSCIYPKNAPQPLKEEYLLSSKLEPTNEPYSIAKIAAIKLCRYYNEQHGTTFISAMPCNLYGPNDSFDLKNAHVLPMLIRKFHLAKLLSQNKFQEIFDDLNISEVDTKKIIDFLGNIGISSKQVTLWGTGNPFREFLFVDDLAKCCVFLMKNSLYKDLGEFINIGSENEIQIRDLAKLIKKIVEFKGKINFDSKIPDGTPRKLLDISKIKQIGWHSKINLIDGVEKAYAWYLEKKQGNYEFSKKNSKTINRNRQFNCEN